MKNSIKNNQSAPTFELNETILEDLRVTGRWAMVSSIVGFFGLCALVIVACSLGIIKDWFTKTGYQAIPFPILRIVGFINLIMIVALYILPVVLLFFFASNLKIGIKQREVMRLELAVKNLKFHYMYIGIITIIVFCTYLFTAAFIGLLPFLGGM